MCCARRPCFEIWSERQAPSPVPEGGPLYMSGVPGGGPPRRSVSAALGWGYRPRGLGIGPAGVELGAADALSPTPFTFHDPEQRRAHRLLHTVGEGAADFFEDACRMLSRPEELRTTSHLVGHALREAESAVRKFALALANAREAAAANEP